MKYGELNLGQIEAIVNKLGGMYGVTRFLAGVLEVKEVEYKVWRTIKRDPKLNSAEAFLSALAEKGCKASDWAKDILGKPDFVKSLKEPEQKYNLFVLTTAQLTGKENTISTTEEIFAGIERLDFQLCPVWVGPQLRLDYQDQPNNEWRYIAMKQILDSDGRPYVFYVKRDDSGLWLYGYDAYPGSEWASDTHWVVCRPCKQCLDVWMFSSFWTLEVLEKAPKGFV